MVSLNAEQQAAVSQFGHPLLVLAGAGCGKTRVITHKINHLIEYHKLTPSSITAVTFTNKAAKEMKSRLAKENTQGVFIMTFHTLGMKILQVEAKNIGYSNNFTIFDQQDSAKLLKELTKDNPVINSLGIDKAAQTISLWKNSFLTVEHLLQTDNATQYALAQIYQAYQKQLKAYNAFDFDDLIVQTTLLLQTHETVRQRWQNRIEYLLVDEYQDTNPCQYELLKQLVGNQGRFTVVGDDDQAIYGFRGACKENLFRLQEDFKNLEVIKLEQNYRSYTSILKTSNQLIAHNPHIYTKKLWSNLGYGEPTYVVANKTSEEEAETMIARLMQHKFQNSNQFKDYAILYRSNHQARIFEKVLRSYNPPISYQVSGGLSWFDRTEVKDFIAYLRLLANPDDNVAFLRVINVPKREIGAATLAKLGEYAKQRQQSLSSCCDEMGLKSILTPKAFAALYQFYHWLIDISDRAMRGDPIAVIEDMLKEIDYQLWLEESGKDIKSAEKRWQNVQEVLDWLRNLQYSNDQHLSIQDFANHLTLMGILDRDNEKPKDAVQLMTLHAAKGLEFSHVFLVGMEEDILPHKNSIENDDIEEERRLAYVGMTRAQKSLTLSYALKRKRFDQEIDCTPSRFLEELPQEDLIWENKDQNNQTKSAEQHAQINETLMKLKEILNK